MRRQIVVTGLALGWGLMVLPAVAWAQSAPGGPGEKPAAAADGGGGERGRGGPEGRGGPGGPRGGFGMMPLMKALDADGNGELSGKEIDDASDALRSLDKNKDGKLARDEMFGNMGERGGRGEGGRGEGGRGGGPSPAELVGQLMAFDKNEDGKLTAEELPERMRNLVDRADTNKDGSVDKEELTRYAELQQQARGGAGGGRGGRGPEGGGRGGPPMMPFLRALDADGNGELSADEMGNAAAALRTLDKNRDGKLTRDELVGEMGGGRGRGRGFGPGEGGGPGPRGGEGR